MNCWPVRAHCAELLLVLLAVCGVVRADGNAAAPTPLESSSERAAQKVEICFMTPVSAPDAKMPTYAALTDPEKLAQYREWLKNESATMALDLYARVWRLVRPANEPPVLRIALVPKGNNPATGFSLENGEKTAYPREHYIKLDPSPTYFGPTFLHETGHVLLQLLAGDKRFSRRGPPLYPGSHTTAALTDRLTAFNEGFAIHLETTIAHIGSDPIIAARYFHPRFVFGTESGSEYDRASDDLLTLAQVRTRYVDVRENHFAFLAGFRGADYQRVQFEKSRDFAALRDANQLLQSEGFHATFFFSVILRGEATVGPAQIAERYDKLFSALKELLRNEEIDDDTPLLLKLVERYTAMFPAEAAEISDVLLDLSHGVFADGSAATLWGEHYLSALKLDSGSYRSQTLVSARRSWRAEVRRDSGVWYSRLGPQLRCEIRDVGIAFRGKTAPLSFDVNTAEEGILRMIPAIADAEIDAWVTQRQVRAFASVADFKQRAGVAADTLKRLQF